MQTHLRKTYSSGEYLALKRAEVERTVTRVPTLNLQEASTHIERTRKLANRFAPKTGSSVGIGMGTSSVVQAMREGDAVCCSARNYVLPTDSCTILPDAVLNPGGRDPTWDFSQYAETYPTITKAVVCDEQRVPAFAPQECTDLKIRFGMGNPSNKVVISGIHS